MSLRSNAFILAAALVAPLALSSTAAAQGAAASVGRGDDYEKAGGEYRQVNGHRFITPSIDAYSALTNSSIMFEQGFGALIANFKTNTHIPGIGTIQPQLFEYHQLLAGQIAIANRVSIDLRAKGTADLGSNIENLLTIGVVGTVEAGGGPKVRLFTVDKIGLTVSVGANISYYHFVELSPFQVVAAIANGKSASKGVQQQDAFFVSPLAMLAEGVGPFGVQFTAYPRFAGGGAKQTDLFLDFHLAFDVGRVTRHAPVAITFEYQPDFLLDPSLPPPLNSLKNTFAVGVYYSGRRDFTVGGLFDFVADGQQDANDFAGQMTMQYFF
jgi:hypothetical protein